MTKNSKSALVTAAAPVSSTVGCGELLNHEQTAAYLNVIPRTLTEWRYTRGVPFIKITSKVVRYRKSDIDRWLEERRTVIA